MTGLVVLSDNSALLFTPLDHLYIYRLPFYARLLPADKSTHILVMVHKIPTPRKVARKTA